MDIDQVPGVGALWLHPELEDTFPGCSLLVVLPGHMVEEPLRLVEADPAEEAVVAPLAWEVALAHVQMVVSVLVLVIILLADEHEVAEFAHSVRVILPSPLQYLQPGSLEHDLLNVILHGFIVDGPLDEELTLGHTFQPLVRIVDRLKGVVRGRSVGLLAC